MGRDIITISSSGVSNYVFKKLQMQDLHFTPVNSPSATDTKDESACESLQSLEICIIALDWIMLLRSVVRE
jgi:predicted CoA-binding protein